MPLKNLSAVHVFIVENLMNYMNLLLITLSLAVAAAKLFQVTASQPVAVVIRAKEANTGKTGC